jgi:hypothetical protein
MDVAFTADEVAMLRFLAICQPSLDPNSYAGVENACRMLCEVRRGLSGDSLRKCLDYLSVRA